MRNYIYAHKRTHEHTFIDLPLGRSMRVAYILRMNLVLTYGVPLEFRGGFHLFSFNRHADCMVMYILINTDTHLPPLGGSMRVA